MVVMTVKASLAPILERLAVAEAKAKQADAFEKSLAELRDRVLVMETKAAAVQAPVVAERVDLTPLSERMAIVETKLQDPFRDMQDRLVTLEHSHAIVAAAPPRESVDLNPLTAQVSELRDRVLAVETKPEKTFDLPPLQDLSPLYGRVSALEAMASSKAVDATRISDLSEKVADIHTKVAVLEVRAQVPGPAGKDGQPGRDGADGLSFDDLQAVQNDDRSFTVKAVRGDRVKDIGTARFPVLIQRGVYADGASYEPGDMVTWGGSQWHCNEATTTKPGEGSKAWTLTVKRGRDGRDGKDAPIVPVVSIGRAQ